MQNKSTAGRRALCAVLAVGATGAWAEAPRVVADIGPVHGLVSEVMQGAGTPDMILAPGASPHGGSLRPSEARALSQADVVFWIGPALTPWLVPALEELAQDAEHVSLMKAPGIRLLEVREGAGFEAHDHDHGHDEAHDDEHDEAHGEEHDEGHEEARDHGDHGAEPIDPHVWLDPANAMVWLDVIAQTLSAQDPENASLYARNAKAAVSRIAAQMDQVAARMAPVAGRPFVVFHDAFHYFEARFDVEATGAISVSDAMAPSPARVAEIRDLVAESGAVCVMSEPQFNAGLIDAVGAQKSGVADPLGAGLTPGVGFYAQLIDALAISLETCLKD